MFAGLADLHGYYLPFLLTGLLPILPAAVATVTMTSGASVAKENVSIVCLLKIPRIFMMCVAMILCFKAPLMLEPILASHLQQFNLNLTVLGTVFLITPLTFTIIAPFLGKLVKHLRYKLLMMIGGIYCMTLNFFLLGPSPLIGLKPYQHLWPTLLNLVAMGLFWAFIKVPMYDEWVSYCTQAYPDIDQESLMTALGSLMWLTISLGELTSPVIADSIFDAYDFQWTMTVAGFMCFFTGTMFLVTFMCSCETCDVSGFRNIKHKEGIEKEALLDSFNLSGNYSERTAGEDDCGKLTQKRS